MTIVRLCQNEGQTWKTKSLIHFREKCAALRTSKKPASKVSLSLVSSIYSWYLNFLSSFLVLYVYFCYQQLRVNISIPVVQTGFCMSFLMLKTYEILNQGRHSILPGQVVRPTHRWWVQPPILGQAKPILQGWQSNLWEWVKLNLQLAVNPLPTFRGKEANPLDGTYRFL